MNIRKIQPTDNLRMAAIVREVIVEMGAPKVGTAYEDKALDDLFATYNKERAVYFVIEDQNEIVGGAGIAHLPNEGVTVCELQKMYFLSTVRGKGYGMKMMETCLSAAREFGFSKCYIETMPYMTDAQKLYKKAGFYYIDAPMGNTGHYSCPVWMLKDL
ncbi:GNAT family N-acetyltransferase [Galbibacter pacificus]|uniref:GNAT family N-acetyltransferase n=1 Tax=Galbibacter pacificus TaxID=2996052 RepID=A0ABT6FPZ1_9FLAO|nr:GNAT family N-acetyltransferase [Galbibacter pacificus]MDG3582365.1 GNAT family N-acetyltransferase [Galbibacter pacificus]MDG3585159.1 GNAT family N-acetyltransferase [Galbibacter pacificus]